MKEKWIADFSKPEKSCFDIKAEISHDAYLDKGALFLGLKKKNSIACVETADRVYVDQHIEARFRLDDLGGYSAAGIMFRINEKGTYYLALLSNRGYFRLDAVNNGVPQPLIGWTKVSVGNGPDGNGASLGIIVQGDHFIFLLDGKWIAEVRDDLIPGGHLGFALVSYNTESGEEPGEQSPPPDELPADTGNTEAAEEDSRQAKTNCVCKAWLDFLSVDSRRSAVGAQHKKYSGIGEVRLENRLLLAESFAAIERYASAHDQVLKAWKQREEAARSVMATFTEMRTKAELIFAARMASKLGQYETAEEYIDVCLALGDEGTEGLDALSEKAIILSTRNKYDELAAFLPGYISRVTSDEDAERLPPLYGLLGHAFWNLQDYQAAADAWDKAFSLDENNGLYAAKAADAWEMLGKNAEALKRRLAGGNCFLQQKDLDDLEVLVPKLLAVGKKSWEAHALAGKWAFVVGNFDHAEAELAVSDELRRAMKSKKEASAKTKAEKKPPAAKPPDSGKGKTKPAAKAPAAKPKTAAKSPAAKTPTPKPKAAAKPKTAARPPAPGKGKPKPAAKTTAASKSKPKKK